MPTKQKSTTIKRGGLGDRSLMTLLIWSPISSTLTALRSNSPWENPILMPINLKLAKEVLIYYRLGYACCPLSGAARYPIKRMLA